MKVFSLFLICTLFFLGANAQSFFKSIAKPKNAAQLKLKQGVALTSDQLDEIATEKTEFRPAVNMISYIIGKDVKEASLITGAGASIQRVRYNADSDKWNILWSANLLLYGRVALGNESNGKKLLAGVSLGAFDNKLMVGYATDLKNSYGTIGVGIPLNNL